MNQTQSAFQLLESIIPDECPELTDTLLQLKRLHQAGSQPVVAAIGDYNVGKSSLLNALIGEDIFAVADRRETRQVARHMAGGICWLDTPGLDADLTAGDDQRAHCARHQADVLLFLHNVSNGELSPNQLAQLQQLQQLPQGPQLQLVLTRIDECQPVALAKICARIQGQVETLPILPISEVVTSYYLRMRVEDKPGVLADITRILADRQISIDAMIQREPDEGEEQTDIIMLTHQTREKNVEDAIAMIEKLSAVKGGVTRLRLEGLL